MKILLLIPAMCLLCYSCGSNNNQSVSVQTQESSADWTITTKVKAAIMADSSISASARFVSVETNEGVVTLTGTVPSKSDRERIVKIAKGVQGVVKVNNQITISG